jgi:putative membrane-bound dehydrogenase-like protein
MISRIRLALAPALMVFLSMSLGAAPILASDQRLKAVMDEKAEEIRVFRAGSESPIVTQVARPDFRPYIHPLVAPDGKGLMTQFSPDHHRHQTGLYWGFTRLNGRDYFHHPDGDYWKRVSASVLKSDSQSDGDSVQWQTVYDLLDANGQSVLRESQIWTMRLEEGRYVFDLQWTGQAMIDVVIDKYDYGGLFVRMPWYPGIEGQAVNSARQRDSKAEGQRAVWLDVGMKVEGRPDQVHLAIFDHPLNSGYPQPWRVDSQLGIGPSRARLGDWRIVQGQQETIRHRLIAYVGQATDAEIMQQWSDYSGVADWAMWGLAQQAGRQAEFLTPEKAVATMTVQPGFQVNLFASEPMISQPMAFCWDARGRLWVAENRDYESRGSGFSSDGSSRILILEDTDRDGVADSRKIFLEGIPFPAAIAVGMGGLWLGAPPNLLFVPDSDQDDRADFDQIQVRLTGWGIKDRHETLNSLHWGPDGWLYGLQGFATPSTVGKPKGSGKIYRHNEPFPEKVDYDGPTTEINGGVWRYHPSKDRFEVVAHGFSNPWGIDFDAHGQFFITACVIPHLWHVIPGGIYHRQGGQHFNPYVYEDIKTIAQHRHQSAHGGARVYQSDAFPQQYHGRVFMANIHEHAVLTDIVETKGSGFQAKHGDDFALANNDQWVGFSVEVGPEGAVYALDWHDADICGKEVLQKETGRIFRFMPEKSLAADFPNRYADLNRLTDQQLVALQWVPSAWHAGQSRTILQHRSLSRPISKEAVEELQRVLASNQEAAIRLRALWTLHVIKGISEETLAALGDDQPYLRAWAVQLLCEDLQPSDRALARMLELARSDPSPVVRLYLACATQRVDDAAKWKLLELLTLHAEDNTDHNIPKMLWYGLEPLVVSDSQRALALAKNSQIALISRWIARRLADDGQFDVLIGSIPEAPESAQIQMLLGLRDALEGRYDLRPPAAWSQVLPRLLDAQPPRESSSDPSMTVAELARQISTQFGDAQSASLLLRLIQDAGAQVEQRQDAVRQLAGRKRPELLPVLPKIFEDPQLRREAIRAVAAYDDPSLARWLLQNYEQIGPEEKQEIVQALASRTRHGNELTAAIGSGKVPKRDVPAHVARLLRRVVGNRFVDVWGPIDELTADKEAQYAKYRELLSPQALAAADLNRGKELFQRTCAACHQLHGQGGKIGPDITGANRGNLEYLLSNILTPSAVIQDDYRMHIILTDDGRIYSGIPSEETERYLKLLVAESPEPTQIPKSAIESREIAAVSLMPDGLLANLTDAEAIDLIGYLQSAPQVTQAEATE